MIMMAHSGFMIFEVLISSKLLCPSLAQAGLKHGRDNGFEISIVWFCNLCMSTQKCDCGMW